jgi:Nucleolar protein,Nop52
MQLAPASIHSLTLSRPFLRTHACVHARHARVLAPPEQSYRVGGDSLRAPTSHGPPVSCPKGEVTNSADGSPVLAPCAEGCACPTPQVAFAYYTAFVETMRREWFGIDRHRLDKACCWSATLSPTSSASSASTSGAPPFVAASAGAAAAADLLHTAPLARCCC